MSKLISVKDYKFNNDTPDVLTEDDFYSNWPVVYLINNKKELYIGETYHANERMKEHLGNPERLRLTDLHVIGSDLFTKSSTLDLESTLIELCSLEKMRTLQNGNHGLVNHNYANKASFSKDSKLFYNLWKELKQRGLVKDDLENLLNSDLFKFSPYKSLNPEQCTARDGILEDIKDLFKENKNGSIFVDGQAGTGKTILAVYLMRLLVSNASYITAADEGAETVFPFINTLKEIKQIKPEIKIGYVVSMTSLRSTINKVFGSIKELKGVKAIAPNNVADEYYDILIVDEAHRLCKYKNIVNRKVFKDTNQELGFDDNGNQLDWILKQSQIQILFYDSSQSIRPSDVDEERFNELKNANNSSRYLLSSQMRCNGGSSYVKYVEAILNNANPERKEFSENYDLKLFDNIDDLCNEIYKKEKELTLCRILAGYGFEWVSKHDPSKFDIVIDNHKFKWNKDVSGWPLSLKGEEILEEVGCIHKIQGYDLNYAAVIFGPEIYYDGTKICIDLDKYYDSNGKKATSTEEVQQYILNIYKVLMTRGIRGTYVYCVDKKLNEYFSRYMDKYGDNNG